jgi:hypothetical protein
VSAFVSASLHYGMSGALSILVLAMLTLFVLGIARGLLRSARKMASASEDFASSKQRASMAEAGKAKRRARPTTRVWTSEYLEGFLTPSESQNLLAIVQQLPYVHYEGRSVLKRGQCDFGASYPPSGAIGLAPPIIPSLAPLAERIGAYCDRLFDQLIVTWYPADAPFAPHWDNHRWFGDTIAAVSLGATCELRGHPPNGAPRVRQFVASGSMYVMRGERRYEWKHEIPKSSARRNDRWSLTLRELTTAAHERLAALKASAGTPGE